MQARNQPAKPAPKTPPPAKGSTPGTKSYADAVKGVKGSLNKAVQNPKVQQAALAATMAYLQEGDGKAAAHAALGTVLKDKTEKSEGKKAEGNEKQSPVSSEPQPPPAESSHDSQSSPSPPTPPTPPTPQSQPAQPAAPEQAASQPADTNKPKTKSERKKERKAAAKAAAATQ